jgi:hypothetical protein
MTEVRSQKTRNHFKNNKYIFLLMLFLVLIVIGVGCQRVEKPSMGGEGVTSLQTVKNVDIMPWYHLPVDNWRATHMDFIEAGKVQKENCLPCHYEPDKFCNRCHGYVGVKKVFPENKTGRELLSLEIMKDLEPTPDHDPLVKWRTAHDEAIVFGQSSIDGCLGCHFEPDNFCNKCHLNAGIRKIVAQ